MIAQPSTLIAVEYFDQRYLHSSHVDAQTVVSASRQARMPAALVDL